VSHRNARLTFHGRLPAGRTHSIGSGRRPCRHSHGNLTPVRPRPPSSASSESNDVTITWVAADTSIVPWKGEVTLTGGAVDAGTVCAEGEGGETDFGELEADEVSMTLRLDMTVV
jgi:hypothetical protein